jgi:hypothetical protein
MKNITKQELISNLQDKISEFKSNFTKIKESRKEVPELNFEINRDALKLFSKKKSETDEQSQNLNQNQMTSKPQSKIDDIYNIKDILNEKNQIQKFNQNIKNDEKKSNKKEKENNPNIGAKIKKSYTLGEKENYNKEINQNKIENKNINDNYSIKKEYQNNDLYNTNINKIAEINNIDNLNIYGVSDYNLNPNNQKNNELKKPESNKENNILDQLNLNNDNYKEFNFNGIKQNKKLEKRDKSAPKITINQKINNFYSEKPLTDKKHQNIINNINHTSNYNQLFINRKSNNTEELYQKLLMNFNINSSSNKRDKTFFDLNSMNNNNNKYTREDNPNKSYGQINLRDTNMLYEINGNSNNNYYYNLQKKNYYRNNGLNLDHLKDLYSKKTEDYKRPTQSMFKSKMDMFYQELNEYKNANYNKKKELKNYSKKNKYFNNNTFMANTQYGDYNLNNNINSNININQNNNNINNKNIFNGNQIGFNEISAVKRYLNDLTKEEINNLPMNIKTELKDIFNILYQKLNE